MIYYGVQGFGVVVVEVDMEEEVMGICEKEIIFLVIKLDFLFVDEVVLDIVFGVGFMCFFCVCNFCF